MGSPYAIAYGSESVISKLNNWNDFFQNGPEKSVELVIAVLGVCPFLKHDGSTFWGEQIDEFKIEPRGIFFESVDIVGREEVNKICWILARKIGTVTLIGEQFSSRFEVTPTTSDLEIRNALRS